MKRIRGQGLKGGVFLVVMVQGTAVSADPGNLVPRPKTCLPVNDTAADVAVAVESVVSGQVRDSVASGAVCPNQAVCAEQAGQ